MYIYNWCPYLGTLLFTPVLLTTVGGKAIAVAAVILVIVISLFNAFTELDQLIQGVDNGIKGLESHQVLELDISVLPPPPERGHFCWEA